jgi:hypothetical protein
MHRDHRGDPGARDPFIPVSGAKQRDALKFVQENILSDTAFSFPPELLRKLAADRWMHWGNDRVMSSVDFPLYQKVLSIQSVAINQFLNNSTLSRIQNNIPKAAANDKPLAMSEVFRSLTDGIWIDVANAPKQAKKDVNLSIIRRNLQRKYVQSLSDLVLNAGGISDGKSLARMHLKEIQKNIVVVLADKTLIIEDASRAHLDECQERIQKVLTASIQSRE